MKLTSLNKLYNQYTDKIITRQKLEGYIYKYFLLNQKNTCCYYWATHEYEDFVSWFFPRLQKAIDKYNNKKMSFESFINGFFFISSKEYKVQLTAAGVTEYSTWSARVPDLYVHEDPPEYLFDNKNIMLQNIINNKNGRKNSKRILALILKCYNYVSDDFIEKAAPIIEMKPEKLKSMVDNMRKIRQKKDDNIYLLKEKMFYHYYRCIVLEKRLSLVKENTSAYSRLKCQLDNAKRKQEKLRNRLKIVRKDATNSQVAEIIGVRKGTVDASLFKLKEKFTNQI